MRGIKVLQDVYPCLPQYRYFLRECREPYFEGPRGGLPAGSRARDGRVHCARRPSQHHRSQIPLSLLYTTPVKESLPCCAGQTPGKATWQRDGLSIHRESNRVTCDWRRLAERDCPDLRRASRITRADKTDRCPCHRK